MCRGRTSYHFWISSPRNPLAGWCVYMSVCLTSQWAYAFVELSCACRKALQSWHFHTEQEMGPQHSAGPQQHGNEDASSVWPTMARIQLHVSPTGIKWNSSSIRNHKLLALYLTRSCELRAHTECMPLPPCLTQFSSDGSVQIKAAAAAAEGKPVLGTTRF